MIILATNSAAAGAQKKLHLIENDSSMVESLNLLSSKDCKVQFESNLDSAINSFRSKAAALGVLNLPLQDRQFAFFRQSGQGCRLSAKMPFIL